MCFMSVRNILSPFGTFYVRLVYFWTFGTFYVCLVYIFCGLVGIYFPQFWYVCCAKKKSGSPGLSNFSSFESSFFDQNFIF
jgi:hypothetical protein